MEPSPALAERGRTRPVQLPRPQSGHGGVAGVTAHEHRAGSLQSGQSGLWVRRHRVADLYLKTYSQVVCCWGKEGMVGGPVSDRQGGRGPESGQCGDVDRRGMEAGEVEAGQAQDWLHGATSHTRIIIILYLELET